MKSLASFSGKNANSSTSMKSTDLPRIEDDEDAACLAEEHLKQAAVLIPLYGHRFVPCLDGVENPPVLSVYGGDIIYYGENLQNWLEIEFFGKSRDSIRRETIPVIPGWQELIG